MFDNTRFGVVLNTLLERLNPLLADIRAAENKRAANEEYRQANETARQEALVKSIDEKSTYSQYASAKAIYDLFKKNIVSNVYSWLDEHPEATTTVQDGSLTESKFTEDLKNLTLNNYVIPQMFGAVGDGVTDDTQAFIDTQAKAQELGVNIYVPSGSYVLNDFTFASSANWFFQCGTGEYWWSGDNVAKILTSTGVTIGRCGEIKNLIVLYSGDRESPDETRGSGIKMSAHHTKIVNCFIKGFNIGVDIGVYGHCDYVQFYNLYSIYNYFAGVALRGDAANQVNNISFYDGNVGANGVSPHDRSIEPDTSRGYGFYITSCNSVTINNVDVSANETCGFYIDNDTTEKVARGLSVPVFYAEHNKYCDVYYNNDWNNETCRSDNIIFDTAYIFHDDTDIFFKRKVVTSSPINIPSVNILGIRGIQKECDCFIEKTLEKNTYNYKPNIKELQFLCKPNHTYKVTLKLLGETTGSLTITPSLRPFYYDEMLGFYRYGGLISGSPTITIPLVEGEETVYSFELQIPDSNYGLLLYRTVPLSAFADTPVLSCTIDKVLN